MTIRIVDVKFKRKFDEDDHELEGDFFLTKLELKQGAPVDREVLAGRDEWPPLPPKKVTSFSQADPPQKVDAEAQTGKQYEAWYERLNWQVAIR